MKHKAQKSVEVSSEGRLIFWPTKKQEKAVAIIREMFEDSDFNTDRCWSQNDKTKRYGTRIFGINKVKS